MGEEMTEERKRLEALQIEVGRYWAGVEEVKNCPWILQADRSMEVIIKRIPFASVGKMIVDHMREADLPLYPYLKIEDGNPWSSAAILARAGWTWGTGLLTWLSGIASQKTETLPEHSEWLRCITLAMDNGYQELTLNLALQWLHKNAPDVWAKGMEGLR